MPKHVMHMQQKWPLRVEVVAPGNGIACAMHPCGAQFTVHVMQPMQFAMHA
jgi:hypothetical protein